MPAQLQRNTVEKIRLLSDGLLYREALDFAAEQGTVDGQAQMASLLSYTQSWDDLANFVRHQSQRDWIGRKAYYKQFYAALDGYLNRLRQRVSDEWFSPPGELSKNDRRTWIDEHAIMMAREFIQHLAAENLYQERLQKRQRNPR